MGDTPFMLVVEGSARITRGDNARVTVFFDIFHYNGRMLATNILSGVEGATLTHQCALNDRLFGAGHRYFLEVDGDALRCAAIQNVIISTIENNPAKTAEWRNHARRN